MEEKKAETPEKSKIDWKGFLSFKSFAWLALVLFAFDLITKWVIQGTLKTDGASVPVIDGFWYLTLTHNTFAAFGNLFSIDEGNTSLIIAVRILLIAISWGMSIAIAWYWGTRLKKKDYLLNAILALLFAGAIGNLIDRTFYWTGTVGFDGVIDFMCFYLSGTGNEPFAIFNVADACLSVGIALLIVVIIIRDFLKNKHETAAEQEKEQLGDGTKDHKD